jgi:hypothetical protein
MRSLPHGRKCRDCVLTGTMPVRLLNNWLGWRKIILLYIGNDIVDLTAPENLKKSLDGRFLDRVFTPDEQDLIGSASWADAMLWALWAGKEGAYKVLSKGDPGIPSTPRRYHVKFFEKHGGACLHEGGDALWSGIVDSPAGKVSFQTLFTVRYVHCLAITDVRLTNQMVISQVVNLADSTDTSFAVRRAAVGYLAAILDISPAHIEIRRFRTPKGYGPPRVFLDGRPADIDISLSHDGDYGAFAFCC